MKLPYSILLIAVVSISNAKVHKSADEMRFRSVERKVEATLRTIEKLYENDDDFLVALKKSQSDWEKHRESTLLAFFPKEDKYSAYGESYEANSFRLLEGMTRDRLNILTIWVKGQESNELGHCSVKSTSELKKIRENQAVDTTAANARLFHDETTKSTNPGVEAMTEAAVVSP
ncbi:hypothetical protein [Pelagicoccus sp. SDUM812005]|uniref:hypothetical protein n=1 Tax=Pelagicoccus sp. SDUM812005 TaxID=3041257 RepID=UPI00280CE414|nr:hypothetical protein [Pelagicoccus sp. SDUM812005]MDQ8183880.1 hypothetical protein [Pelagicoccus sp. SDUM812005]